MKMKWEPVDIVVLSLAGVIAFVLVFGELKLLLTDRTLSAEAVKAYTHLTGALIAIISLYVGSKLGNRNKKEE